MMGSPSCPQSPAELPAQGRDLVTTGPMKGHSTHPNAAQSDDGVGAVLCRPAWPDEKKPQREMLPGPGPVTEGSTERR